MDGKWHISVTVEAWWIALLGAALVTLLAAAYSRPPFYRAASTLFILVPDEPSLGPAAQTFADLATSPPVLQRASERLGPPSSPEDVRGRVTASPVRDTLLVAVTAEAEDPVLARDIANATASALVEAQGTPGFPAPSCCRVQLAQPATAPEPVRSNTALGLLMGALSGLTLGVVAIEVLRWTSGKLASALGRGSGAGSGVPFHTGTHRVSRESDSGLAAVALIGSSLLVLVIGAYVLSPKAQPAVAETGGARSDATPSQGESDKPFSTPEVSSTVVNRAVIAEDFRSTGHGWPDYGQAPAWYDESGYRLQAAEPGRFVAIAAPVQAKTNVNVAGTFHKVGGASGGAYGLILRDSGPAPRDGVNQTGDFYIFSVTDLGSYGFFHWETNHWTDIVPYSFSDAVHRGGGTNTLEGRIIGDQLTLLVNEREVGVVVSTARTGNVGVWVGGDGNDVLLTRYEVGSPESGEAVGSAPEPTAAPEPQPVDVESAADTNSSRDDAGINAVSAATIRAPSGFAGAVLRSAPSPAAPMLASLPNGTPIERIGGRQVGGAFTWLEVRTPTGLAGWVVSATVAANEQP